METDAGKTEATLQCPTCRNNLSLDQSANRVSEDCPVCRSEVRITIFPRFYQEPPKQINSPLASEDEAVCSFYPELRAEKVCDVCGCLMSQKASAKWGDKDYCLPCLYRLREEEKDAAFVARARLYDNRALAMVTWFAPLSLFTAPVALFLLLRHGKGNQSFVPRSAARWWLALLLSSAWILLWGAIIIIWISLVLSEVS